jgi:multidrug efflux pump subunit AcrA (membrane-fusion protein)
VEIESASAKNALALPREAALREGGQTFVWVVNDSSQAERREIELGVASASRVEIRSGLSESDRVLLPGRQVLTAGQDVRLLEGRQHSR